MSRRFTTEPIEATLEIDATTMDAAMTEAERQLEAFAPARSWSVRTSVTPCIENLDGRPVLWHFEMHCIETGVRADRVAGRYEGTPITRPFLDGRGVPE